MTAEPEMSVAMTSPLTFESSCSPVRPVISTSPPLTRLALTDVRRGTRISMSAFLGLKSMRTETVLSFSSTVMPTDELWMRSQAVLARRLFARRRRESERPRR